MSGACIATCVQWFASSHATNAVVTSTAQTQERKIVTIPTKNIGIVIKMSYIPRTNSLLFTPKANQGGTHSFFAEAVIPTDIDATELAKI